MTDYPIRKPALDFDVASVRERYLKLTTGQVYDVLAELGHPGRAMEPGIYPLVSSMKVAGPAFTVQATTTPSMAAVDTRLGMVKSMTEGCIQIRNAGGNADVGHFGEINATAAFAAGCRGAVLDGSTRDSNWLIEMGFPTFCRYRSPAQSFGRYMVTDYQVPIFVHGMDGHLLVEPGDFVVGDNDGVVIVPKALTLETLERAEKKAASEALSRAEVATGKSPLDVQEKYGKF
jgi:regulator of RNase E activity RraA